MSRMDLSGAVKNADRRTQLEGVRDFLLSELENTGRCPECESRNMKAADTAALTRQLMKVLDELNSLPANTGKKSTLESLRENVDGVSDVPEPTVLGTKSATRRQSTRRRGA